jgi:hypothetical protein
MTLSIMPAIPRDWRSSVSESATDDAVSVPEKIDEDLHFFLVYEVKGHVTKYFLFIEAMQDLARQAFLIKH